MTQSGSQQPEEKPEEPQEKNGHQEEYNPSVIYEHVASDVYYEVNPETLERDNVETKDNIIPPEEDERNQRN